MFPSLYCMIIHVCKNFPINQLILIEVGVSNQRNYAHTGRYISLFIDVKKAYKAYKGFGIFKENSGLKEASRKEIF